jgi:hypothetical protein
MDKAFPDGLVQEGFCDRHTLDERCRAAVHVPHGALKSDGIK